MTTPYCGAPESERLLCENLTHVDYHHARSMNEIQKAIRDEREVFDPDGDAVYGARIKPKQKKDSPTAEGKFQLGDVGGAEWGESYTYQVDQILVRDEPFDEEEAMRTILASLAKTL